MHLKLHIRINESDKEMQLKFIVRKIIAIHFHSSLNCVFELELIMSKPILFYLPMSPRARFAYLVAKEIGLEIDLR